MRKLLLLFIFLVGCTPKPKINGLALVEFNGPKGIKCTGLVYGAGIPVPITKKIMKFEYESIKFYYRVDNVRCGNKEYKPFMAEESVLHEPDMFDDNYKKTHKLYFFVQQLKSLF